jgi:hypothetical protein
MPVDTSIYGDIQYPDPLGQVDRIAQTANALVQAQSSRADLQSRIELGKLIQQNTTPDGFNANALAAAAARDPNAVFAAKDAVDFANKQQTLQLANNQTGLTNIGNRFASMVAQSSGPISADQVRSEIVNMGAEGLAPQAFIKGLLQTVPPDGDLKPWLTGQWITSLPSSVAAAPAPAAPGPGGEERKQTTGQFIAQATGPGSGAASDAGGGVTTGLPVGASEAMTASAKQLGEDRIRAATFKQTSYPLTQAIPLIQKLGATGVGPGSEEWNHFKTLLQSWGIPTGAGDKTTMYNELKKYLNQNVMQTGNTSTNDKLESSFASSPNLNLDDNALLNLSKSALSLQRLQQAQVLAFDQATDKNGNPLPVSDYSKWATKWSTGQDVRAFGWDLMTPAEREKVWNSIPADKRDAFKQSVGLAQSLNLFSPGATANAQ